MFKQSTRPEESESRQPLLDDPAPHTLFTAGDDSDDDLEGTSALITPKTARGSHNVSFKEEVQLIPPPLRSTTSSREIRTSFQFEQDSDELDDDSVTELNRSRIGPNGVHDRRMPLLVGLFDSSASRRSLDASLPLHSANANGIVTIGEDTVDLDELAAKRTAGGGLIDSVANMANSILGAEPSRPGLPYAIRQAGFFAGLTLLIALSVVTDWTIRLIVINAKLSGGHSYIDIMSHCFGSSGRAAVSFFQFAFAFGGKSLSSAANSLNSLTLPPGMCAFGIIIGDTIPQVLRFVFPTLQTIPVLKLFANRQFIIAFCTICFSYPLSLYRDIHKLARASGLALVGMLIIVCSVFIEGPHVPQELKGSQEGKFSIIEPGIFQAIGVISFAFVALITCDLGVMLEITGGVSATTLAFIFPAACYIKLVDKRLPWHSRTKLPAVLCVLFGIVVMAISLFLALAKSWTPEGSAKICV
ncbi:Vacuolar amino acid transporter 2 [Psilocybe cubensis]|uniref:Vacuolar amino acid transporter 2 n=1 Tax=Psilocybe cubensis TaxID=181762 RepID=A0ACB8HCM1_PSICU|nr:Vacuolar amino acid transporter 2 [Psilocybe cubensis]KAH9485392.1 Vacuolar amino acid transporter 2 [Psilocybe cubensis]